MEITTARLHIRDLIEEDTGPMHQLRTDPRVYRFNHFGPETAERTYRWIVNTMVYNQRPGRDSHNCAIVLHATSQVIGWIGWGFDEEDQQQAGDVGIGYAILPPVLVSGLHNGSITGHTGLHFYHNRDRKRRRLLQCSECCFRTGHGKNRHALHHKIFRAR